MIDKAFRNLSKKEQGLIDQFLLADFPGKSELRAQLSNCLARVIDKEGSFEFDIKNKVKSPVTSRIPIEGEFKDIDGYSVCVLLHVVDGLAKEIELYKKDGSKIVKYFTDSFDPSELKIFNPYP